VGVLLNFRRPEIGVALIAAYTVPATVYWIGVVFRFWYGNPFFAIFANRMIMLGLCILTVGGLVTYVFGRKVFLNRLRCRKFAYQPLMVLGLILIVEGIFFYLLTGLGPEGYKWTLKDLPDFSLYTVWYILRIVSGSLFLIDGFIIINSKRKCLKSCNTLVLIIIIIAALKIPPTSATSFQNRLISGLYHGRYLWDSPSSYRPQPYMAGYMDTNNVRSTAEKTRITVSFPNTNASVIQADNWLAGGMFVVGYDSEIVQIDYGFYALLTLNHYGNLCLMVGIIQTYECLPYWPYICPFGTYPWARVLFNATIPIEGISPSTPITLTSSWNKSRLGWVSWDYTVNDITYPASAINVTQLAPTIQPYFYVGSRNLKWMVFIDWMPYWQTYLFQFGVTSSYNIGHGGWNVLLSTPSYFKVGEWHDVEAAKSICGANAMLDTRWTWGGENYEGVSAHYYSSPETHVKFYYSGSTIRDHTLLWGSQ
jgi:hypothetical protein